jgi:geranylgeranyl reductase
MGQNVVARRVTTVARTAGRALAQVVYAVKDGAVLDRPLRVAVIGGGPSGACTAETLAKGGIETYLIERKLDNCKAGS